VTVLSYLNSSFELSVDHSFLSYMVQGAMLLLCLYNFNWSLCLFLINFLTLVHETTRVVFEYWILFGRLLLPVFIIIVFFLKKYAAYGTSHALFTSFNFTRLFGHTGIALSSCANALYIRGQTFCTNRTDFLHESRHICNLVIK